VCVRACVRACVRECVWVSEREEKGESEGDQCGDVLAQPFGTSCKSLSLIFVHVPVGLPGS
jgi:hypothetical protein